jgi:nitrogen fixation protein FixH
MTTQVPRYWLGETLSLALAFTDDAGAAVAATGVAVSAKKPGGSTASASVTSGGGTGLFTADVALDEAGDWWLRATCTGPSAAAVETRVTVLASNVA